MDLSTGFWMLCPRRPLMGRKTRSFLGLYPQPLRKGVRRSLISEYLQ